ncbi:SH3 domain-containing protein [Arachnia propionica]|nr:SH3 domain-containing protein [Arachnia propionica]
MVKARRAALEDDILEATTVDTAPRRGAIQEVESGITGARGRLVTRLIAPLALTGIVVAGAVTLNREDSSSVVADPVLETADLGLSRNLARQELAAPSVTPSPTAEETGPVDPLPTAAAPEATESATPEATAEPTETPSPEATETTEPAQEEKAPEAEPSKSAEPKAELPALGNEAGTMFTTKSVNVRTGPGVDHDVRVTLKAATEVTITDVTQDGWQQINHKGSAGWIKASFLAAEKPEEETVSPSTSGASCNSASAKSIESGLTSRSVGVLRAVCAAFPDVKSYGGYRPDSGYHGKGRAIDVMISGEAGWEIARWARANAKELGVIEVIYSQQIWTTQRASEGWRSMSDRGSRTANHYDHVHISVAG